MRATGCVLNWAGLSVKALLNEAGDVGLLVIGAVGADAAQPFIGCRQQLPVSAGQLHLDLMPARQGRRVATGLGRDVKQITPYPPGIPVITPGERITTELLDYLRSGLASAPSASSAAPQLGCEGANQNSERAGAICPSQPRAVT